MFDPKKLLDDLLGSKIPGTESTVRDKAGQATQLAKDNPLAAGALVAVLLGTGAGRKVTGSALKIGGLAAVAGLAYKAYQNYQKGNQPGAEAEKQPELLPPPSEHRFQSRPGAAGRGRVHPGAGARHDRRRQGRRPYRRRGEEEDRRPPGACRHRLRGRGLLARGTGKAARPRRTRVARQDRGAARRALHRLAPDHRAGFARRARLSRPARRPAAASRRAGRPHRGDGLGRQGAGAGRTVDGGSQHLRAARFPAPAARAGEHAKVARRPGPAAVKLLVNQSGACFLPVGSASSSQARSANWGGRQ